MVELDDRCACRTAGRTAGTGVTAGGRSIGVGHLGLVVDRGEVGLQVAKVLRGSERSP